MSHRNARTTVHGRLLIVSRHRSGMPKSHIAKAMGISRKCVAHWIARYDTEGEAGLFVLETNTQPGMTPLSLVPEQAKYCGMSYEDLVEALVAEALSRGAKYG